MSEEKILNGVDVEVVTGVINAVNEKPDLAKSKFRAKTNGSTVGTIVPPSPTIILLARRCRIPNNLSWMRTNPQLWREKIKQLILWSTF